MAKRFAVISDTHFFAPGTRGETPSFWNRVLEPRSREIGDSLVETVNGLAPDFVIHCGDITGYGDLGNFAFAQSVFERFSCPWYGVLGNHDTWFPGIRDAFSTLRGLAPGRSHYSRDRAGLRFVFLDLVHWVTRPEGRVSAYLDKHLYDTGQIMGLGPAPGQLEWLEKEAGGEDGPPVILVSHPPLAFKDLYPVSTMPRGKPATRGGTRLVRLMGDIAGGDEIRALIGRCPRVKAVFSGHWHISDVLVENGITHCQTASLREYPFEIRLVQISDGALRVSTVGLNDSELRRASYVPEWGNEWVAGTGADREFSISLGPAPGR